MQVLHCNWLVISPENGFVSMDGVLEYGMVNRLCHDHMEFMYSPLFLDNSSGDLATIMPGLVLLKAFLDSYLWCNTSDKQPF